MTVLDQDIDVSRGMAAEMFADEAFREMYESADTDEERAARVIFYVLTKMREIEQ